MQTDNTTLTALAQAASRAETLALPLSGTTLTSFSEDMDATLGAFDDAELLSDSQTSAESCRRNKKRLRVITSPPLQQSPEPIRYQLPRPWDENPYFRPSAAHDSGRFFSFGRHYNQLENSLSEEQKAKLDAMPGMDRQILIQYLIARPGVDVLSFLREQNITQQHATAVHAQACEEFGIWHYQDDLALKQAIFIDEAERPMRLAKIMTERCGRRQWQDVVVYVQYQRWQVVHGFALS